MKQVKTRINALTKLHGIDGIGSPLRGRAVGYLGRLVSVIDDGSDVCENALHFGEVRQGGFWLHESLSIP